MMARRWAPVFGIGWRAAHDCNTTRAFGRNAAGSAAAPSWFSTISRSAFCSEACAPASPAMSRYRSVPVSTTASGAPGRDACQSAIDGAERRACSAIIRASSPPSHAATMRTR